MAVKIRWKKLEYVPVARAAAAASGVVQFVRPAPAIRFRSGAETVQNEQKKRRFLLTGNCN